MVDRTMTGVHPVLQIPYDDKGAIDEEDLRREVEWAIESGVDGVAVALGSSVLHLTDPERDYVLKTVVDQAAGRARVCMNTGAQSTNVAVY
jgi:Dihydrodipicolinate synthase/N-acetylneuraminate lyase